MARRECEMSKRQWVKQHGDDLFFGVLFTFLALVIMGVILIAIFDPAAFKYSNPCRDTTFKTDQSFACLDYQVAQCVASERYTRDECIMLVGGGGAK